MCCISAHQIIRAAKYNDINMITQTSMTKYAHCYVYVYMHINDNLYLIKITYYFGRINKIHI